MSDRPRLLDLFCGAGGAAMGFHRAGFDVVGVDRDWHVGARYPFEFVLADAMTYPLDGFDVIFADPPGEWLAPDGAVGNHADLSKPTWQRLRASGIPWVMQTAQVAIPSPTTFLCGSALGLAFDRHSVFASSLPIFGGKCRHKRRLVKHRASSQALEIDWMPPSQLASATPPAFTEHIGKQMLAPWWGEEGPSRPRIDALVNA